MGRGAFFCAPGMGTTLEVKVLWGSRPKRPRANRNATAARPARKEAKSEAASRRTETGYEAARAGASGQISAKLHRAKASDVDPAAVQRNDVALTRGDLA